MTPAIMATTNCRLRRLRRIRTSSGVLHVYGRCSSWVFGRWGHCCRWLLVLPMLSAPRPNSVSYNGSTGLCRAACVSVEHAYPLHGLILNSKEVRDVALAAKISTRAVASPFYCNLNRATTPSASWLQRAPRYSEHARSRRRRRRVTAAMRPSGGVASAFFSHSWPSSRSKVGRSPSAASSSTARGTPTALFLPRNGRRSRAGRPSWWRRRRSRPATPFSITLKEQGATSGGSVPTSTCRAAPPPLKRHPLVGRRRRLR